MGKSTVYGRLTVARVRVLAELAKDRPLGEVAAALGCSYSGVRSHVQDLKDITGKNSAHALGRW